MQMNRDLMRTGDTGFIKFRFMYRPEYLKVGTTILFREGRTKGLGVVSRIFPDGVDLEEKGFQSLTEEETQKK